MSAGERADVNRFLADSVIAAPQRYWTACAKGSTASDNTVAAEPEVGPIRVAFVGAGYIAHRHAPAVEVAGGTIVGVADPSATARARFAAGTGAAAFPDYRELLRAVHPDAVYVCVPPDQHGALESTLVRLRIPFFVEKPLGLRTDAPRRIADDVAAAGLLTAVGYHWRHLRAATTTHEQLVEQPPYLAVGQWHDGLPGQPWWTSAARSGGQLTEQATHLVDLCRWMMGEVVEMHAVEAANPPLAGRSRSADVAAGSAAILRFEQGAVAALSCTYAMPSRYRVQVEFFSDGVARTVSEEGLTTVGEGVRSVPETSDPFVTQAVEFLHAVARGTGPVTTTYADAFRSHCVATELAALARR